MVDLFSLLLFPDKDPIPETVSALRAVHEGRFLGVEHVDAHQVIGVLGRVEPDLAVDAAKDDVDLGTICKSIDRVAAGTDRFIVDVRRDDEDTVLPRSRMKARILLHFRVVGAGRVEQ